MTGTETAFATLALLATPGPTNTLLFLSGAETSLRRALPRLVVVLAAYMATVIPLALAGQELLERWPLLRPVVAVAAGLWVARLAVKLWHPPAAGQTGTTGPAALAVTTLLNPKALVFGLVLLPSPDRLAANLTVFAAEVLAVSALWLGAGHLFSGKGGNGTALMRRAAAVWMGVLSATLVLRGLSA